MNFFFNQLSLAKIVCEKQFCGGDQRDKALHPSRYGRGKATMNEGLGKPG